MFYPAIRASIFHAEGDHIMTTLTAIIILALFATVITLVWGIGSMVRGGDYDREHSALLMGIRVGLQGLTIVLLLIAVLLAAF
jgi:hypothetical protein